jgi:large subunit ribosomal protein L25
MLEGIVRESIDKQSTKQLRRDGYLIANIYGKDFTNINAAFKANDFIRAMKHKETIAFDIKIAGNTHKVVVQDYQSEPVNGSLLHVDLMVALSGVRATYNVPVATSGTPKGLKNKGMLIYHRKRVPVKCTIENLPETFHFQIDDLDTGDNFLARDLQLPNGVDCYLHPSVPIVGMIKAK